MINHGTHEVFLREALALAEQAHARGDEPFGAVLVVSGEIVLTASNTVILDNDPTRHAELNLGRGRGRRCPTRRCS